VDASASRRFRSLPSPHLEAGSSAERRRHRPRCPLPRPARPVCWRSGRVVGALSSASTIGGDLADACAIHVARGDPSLSGSSPTHTLGTHGYMSEPRRARCRLPSSSEAGASALRRRSRGAHRPTSSPDPDPHAWASRKPAVVRHARSAQRGDAHPTRSMALLSSLRRPGAPPCSRAGDLPSDPGFRSSRSCAGPRRWSAAPTIPLERPPQTRMLPGDALCADAPAGSGLRDQTRRGAAPKSSSSASPTAAHPIQRHSRFQEL